MRLQYQLHNGVWVDAGDRTEEFLTRCERENGPDEAGKLVPRFRKAIRAATRTEVTAALESGQTLRNYPVDWYGKCRDGEYFDRKK